MEHYFQNDAHPDAEVMKKITTAIDLEENTSNVIVLFLLFTLIHVDATCIWDANIVCNF